MKTAVSIPDEIYSRAERLAERTKRSRSRLFSDALGEYLDRHDFDEVTEAMDRAVGLLGIEAERDYELARAAARQRLERTDW